MVKRDADFRAAFGVEVNAHNLYVLQTGSKFEALSADASTLDSLNVHCAIIDELHAHPTRKVWDVLETATGARRQPLMWAITTAGTDKAGICYEQRTYVTKILERVIEDETYFGIIYTVDDEDLSRWNDPEIWRKANPNYGISVKPDDLARKAAKAAQLPAALSNFLTKHLNVWVSADSGLFDMLAWDRARNSELKIEDMTGAQCFIALDLGFVDDIASMVLVFKPKQGRPSVFTKNYLPEETIEESRNSQYSGWHRSGRITSTDGNVTDINAILDDLEILMGQYDVRDLAFDPYNKLQLINQMQARGIDQSKLVEFPQTVAFMSPATEQLMKAIKSGKLEHDGDPVLAWALSNVVGHFDNKGNVYPKKERPENKIDPAIALIMAYSRATASVPRAESVYETRGMRFL